MLWPVGIGRDERQIDFSLRHRTQFNFCFFRAFAQALQRLLVFAQVNALLFFEFVSHPLGQRCIPVIAAQVRIPVRGFHLHHAVAHFQHRNIKCSAAQIKHQDGFVGTLVQAIRQGCGGWLVDDAQHFQPGNLACIFGGLALRVIKVCRHRDDSLRNRRTQISLSIRLQLAQDHGRNFLRRISLPGLRDGYARIAVGASHHLIRHQAALRAYFVFTPAHEALDGVHGVLRIDHCLAFGCLPHQLLAVFIKRHNRWHGALPLTGADHHGITALHHRHDRICRSQINSNNL